MRIAPPGARGGNRLPPARKLAQRAYREIGRPRGLETTPTVNAPRRGARVPASPHALSGSGYSARPSSPILQRAQGEWGASSANIFPVGVHAVLRHGRGGIGERSTRARSSKLSTLRAPSNRPGLVSRFERRGRQVVQLAGLRSSRVTRRARSFSVACATAGSRRRK
jgi:hypothetical protein